MKRLIIIMAVLLMGVSCYAQSDKKVSRKNMTVKEWNRGDGGKGAKVLDHVTKYNENGKKIEEIEYNSNGFQKARVTYEYGSNGKVSREVLYNDSNKAVRIRKFEYNDDGTKHKQYNYDPKGKLQSVKEFEYITKK